jgi:hypothetical protein
MERADTSLDVRYPATMSRALSTGTSRAVVPITTPSSASQSIWSLTVGRTMSAPGPTMLVGGFRNNRGESRERSSGSPPASVTWSWKLAAAASSLPGRSNGASSSTSASGSAGPAALLSNRWVLSIRTPRSPEPSGWMTVPSSIS